MSLRNSGRHLEMGKLIMDKRKYIETLFQLYKNTKRQGPGSPSSTKRALDLLPRLTSQQRILDIGCGTGAQTQVLWRNTDASIVATDIFPEYTAEVERAAATDGATDRVTTTAQDMTALNFPDASFDRIWSEGAIYIMGFQRGLESWRRLLNKEGIIAVTEISWLAETVPPECKSFWQSAYPEMVGVEDNRHIIERCGYQNLSDFVLPQTDWKSYYAPLKERMNEYLDRFKDDDERLSVIEETQTEISMFEKFGSFYGYVFYLARKLD